MNRLRSLFRGTWKVGLLLASILSSQTGQAWPDGMPSTSEKPLPWSLEVLLPPPQPLSPQNGVCRRLDGLASWYGPGFFGRRTASGEFFDPRLMTAAHRDLPFGTHVQVTNPRTGSSIVVRINDRGPFVGNRVLDLSPAAARQLGVDGLAQVQILACIAFKIRAPALAIFGKSSKTT